MSMSVFQQALTTLFSRLDLPVYLTGQTPGTLSFPYLTLSVGSSGFCGAIPITVTAWFLGRSGNQQRSHCCDQLQQLIPEGGVKLTFSGGLATIHRAGDFITLITDATEPRSLGARIRLTVKLYDL